MSTQAVQLAYTNPRCRILFFHTGRVVGTGKHALSNQHRPVHELSLLRCGDHPTPRLRPMRWSNMVAILVYDLDALGEVVWSKLRSNVRLGPAAADVFFRVGIPALGHAVLDVPDVAIVRRRHVALEPCAHVVHQISGVGELGVRVQRP